MPICQFRSFILSAAIALSVTSQASAQTPAGVSPGMQVVDPSGAAVGTVYSVKNDQLVIKTDKHEVLLPVTSFTPSKGKLLFALTQAQLNAQTEQAITEANAKFVTGTPVYGTAGSLAGTIDSVDDTTVTMKLASGKLVRLPRDAMAPEEKGLVLGISAAELQKLASQVQ